MKFNAFGENVLGIEKMVQQAEFGKFGKLNIYHDLETV